MLRLPHDLIIVIELYRLRCPDCGIKAEKVQQLPSTAPFSKRFEDAVGLACDSAPARHAARQLGLAESTMRCLRRLRVCDVVVRAGWNRWGFSEAAPGPGISEGRDRP